MKSEKNTEIVLAKNQLNLFGYENHFDFFASLYKKNKLPNCLLLNGHKGLGKATFLYHLANFVLSEQENDQYNANNFCINKNNRSFKLVNLNTHPNFFLIENYSKNNEIKIEQIRNLLKFVSKTTYSRDLKIILIDNANFLNINSSNALLKVLEEPTINTFFFLTCSNSAKIPSTIRSRCNEFSFALSFNEKKNIFDKLKNEFDIATDPYYSDSFLHFDTPGNVIKYFLCLKNDNLDFFANDLDSIIYFIDKYVKEKNTEFLYFISFLIEKYYRDLCVKDNSKLNSHLLNYSKILKQINNMQKLNLSEKNTFIWIKEVLYNETR